MPAVNCAAARIGCDGCPEGGIGDAKADFLAFHVAAGLSERSLLIGSREQYITASLGPIGDQHSREEQDRHRRPHGPAMALRPGHLSESVGQPAAKSKDCNELNQIAERGWIFERVCAVR